MQHYIATEAELSSDKC